ncbi:MAG: putative DNA-binding domain-containing protein [Pseudomonadota bacterium]
MRNLKELQDNLLNRIIGNDLAAEFIKKKGNIDVSDRLMIHRETVLENLISGLKITYPYIWKLLGEECARGVALAYSHNIENLMSRDKINSFGDKFPEFLSNFSSTNNINYLPDFAELEWLRSKSYESIREEFLSPQDMQDFFINGDENGKLILNSSVYFLKSKFPLDSIQSFLEDPEIKELSLNDIGVYIIVCRVQGKIETLYLSKNQWQFLYNLNSGDAIGKAIECFSNEEVEEQLSIMIQLLLSKQMVKEIVE